ncbi:MAG: DUF3488 and DUF4129 domain-containing transglutaminase family protein [Halobacterium sp.]
MSVADVRDFVAARGRRWRVSAQDVAAGACIAIVVAAYLTVLYDVVTVVDVVPRVDDRSLFVGVVAGAVVLAGVLRALQWKYAVALSAVLLAAGLGLYLSVVPPAYFEAMSPTRFVMDTLALLTGYSVLRMPAAGAWAIAVAPAPTFLAAYFAFRRQYPRAAGIAALALGFFVLTGDSTTTTTLVGVLAAAGAVGFATLAAHRASARQTQVLAVVLAVMIVGSATVTAVPGGRSPLVPASSTTTAGSLVSADGYVGVGGSLRLDPQVQFVVESNRESYYRVAAYDRFTGDGWVRSGDVGAIDSPPPTGDRVQQRFTIKRTLDVIPSAPVPQTVDGIDADITAGGLLTSGPTLYEGDTYEVTSRGPVADRASLADATGEVPDRIADTYLQVPDTTDSRVVDLASSLTADAESPYQKAAAIERWLEANKEYSLNAPDPDGNLVNEFVLGDGPGYCTYFASSMVVMLRSQGVPARFVTGYTPGQRVSEDTWVVRGVDSHAWVEVYIADRGWVKFDPTPGTDRASAEQERVTEARESGVSGVDAAGSEDGTWTPPQTQTLDNGTTDPATGTGAPSARSEYGVGGISNTTTAGDVANITAPGVQAAPGGPGGGSDGGDGGREIPPLSTLAVWGVLVVGLAAGARYTGAVDRAYRALWLRWLPGGDPREEVEAAFERVEYVMEKRYRERNPGETVREFVADVRADDRERRVADLRERARYAGRVDGEDAAEAKRLARSLATEYSRLPGPRR